MNSFDSIENIADNIKGFLDSESTKINLAILYAFNATGKTRISTILNEANPNKCLCYNAFVEDYFTWDNENCVFLIDKNSWLANFINEQGIENDVIDNFSYLVNSKLEPSFNLSEGQIVFKIASGDDDSTEGIKISRGEESLFRWSIFYTVLSTVLDVIKDDFEDRFTSLFNDLKYIIIDDPISSIDDSKIITMALQLVDKINNDIDLKYQNVSILITTHHALFYNVLYNSFRRNNRKFNFRSFVLLKNDKNSELKTKDGDSPFAYHLTIISEIKNAIESDNIKRYHFNLFRSLLEKTANFLGYQNWVDCINYEKRFEFVRITNLYSHGKLSDLEYAELTYEEKDTFKSIFNQFLDEFKWFKEGEV